MMHPLRVRCSIVDGTIVSTDGLFSLDGILAAEWLRRNYPEKYYNDDAKNKLIEPELPLAKVEIAGEKIWAASVAQYKIYGEFIYYWHRRFDAYLAERYLDKLKKVNVKSAQYKNYRMPVNCLLVGELTWFCVGDLDGVKDLLSGVKALGKKRGYGYGMVELDRGEPVWSVEPWPEDWSIWGPEGRLMRVIPFRGELKNEMTVRRWAIRPPGWHPTNWVLAEIPKVGDWDGNEVA